MKKWLISIAGIILVGVSFLALKVYLVKTFCNYGYAIAQKVSRNSLMMIKPGLKVKGLIDNMGEPLYVERGTFIYDQELNSRYDDNADVYIYATPGVFGGFSIYVVVEQRTVNRVYVKYNDFAIYSCSIKKCPEYFDNYNVLESLKGSAT